MPSRTKREFIRTDHQESAYLRNHFAAKCRRPGALARSWKHSGRNALRQTLRDLGFEASDPELAEVYARVTRWPISPSWCALATSLAIAQRSSAAVPRHGRGIILRSGPFRCRERLQRGNHGVLSLSKEHQRFASVLN